MCRLQSMSRLRQYRWIVAAACGAFFAIGLYAQESRWNGLNQQMVEFYRNGRYADGIPVASEAEKVAEATFGPNHPNVANSLNNLAEMYRPLGRYAEAKPLYERALRIEEATVGVDSPLVAATVINMGEMYRAQGDYARA